MENPYNYQGPIKDSRTFFGRSSVIARIYTRIGADRPQSISVVGDPKIGKSSLLWYLSQEECKRRYLTNPDDYIYFYMEIKPEPDLCFKTFSINLCDIITAKIKSIIEIKEAKPSYDLLKRIVEELNQREKKVILFFDDFHLITQNETFPLEFFSFLRSLANHYNLAYVTSSHLDLQKLCVSKDVEESPFFNIFTNMSLKAFTEEEAFQLIKRPFDRAGLSSGSEREAVVKMAGLFPCALQVACRTLFDIKITDGVLDIAAQKAWQDSYYAAAREYFDALWQWFNEEQQEIFKLIVRSRKIDRSKEYLLNDLIKRNYVLLTDGRPSVFSTAFSRFVAEKHNVTWSEPGSRNGFLLMVKDRLKGLFTGFTHSQKKFEP